MTYKGVFVAGRTTDKEGKSKNCVRDSMEGEAHVREDRYPLSS